MDLLHSSAAFITAKPSRATTTRMRTRPALGSPATTELRGCPGHGHRMNDDAVMEKNYSRLIIKGVLV